MFWQRCLRHLPALDCVLQVFLYLFHVLNASGWSPLHPPTWLLPILAKLLPTQGDRPFHQGVRVLPSRSNFLRTDDNLRTGDAQGLPIFNDDNFLVVAFGALEDAPVMIRFVRLYARQPHPRTAPFAYRTRNYVYC